MMEREIKVNVINGELSEEEKNAYIAYEKDKHPTRTIESLDIKVDGYIRGYINGMVDGSFSGTVDGQLDACVKSVSKQEREASENEE